MTRCRGDPCLSFLRLRPEQSTARRSSSWRRLALGRGRARRAGERACPPRATARIPQAAPGALVGVPPSLLPASPRLPSACLSSRPHAPFGDEAGNAQPAVTPTARPGDTLSPWHRPPAPHGRKVDGDVYARVRIFPSREERGAAAVKHHGEPRREGRRRKEKRTYSSSCDVFSCTLNHRPRALNLCRAPKSR